MNKKIALVLLTSSLTLAACSGGNNTPPAETVVDRTLTVNLGGGVTSAPITVSDGTTTQTFTVNNGQVLNLKNRNYTVTAGNVSGYNAPASQTANLTSGNGSVTLNYSAIQVTPPNPVPSGTIVITSPTINQTISGNSVVVNFATDGTLTNIQCGQGTSFTAATNVGAGAGSCAVSLAGVGNGPVTLVVRGTNSTGQTVTSSVTVNLNNISDPNSAITFGPEMTVGPDGRVDYSQYMNGGTRVLVQNNPANAEGDDLVVRYVKGTITLGFGNNGPATATRVEAWISGTIDGAKTGALFNVYDGAPGGSVQFDTTTLNGRQSQVLYLVTRTYTAAGQTTTSVPFVVDNTGPQAPDNEFQGASGAGNRLLRDYGAPNNNFARGAVEFFITNPNLIDQVYNPASGQVLPAGVDSVSYYFVPRAQLEQVTTVTGQDRINRVRQLGTFNRTVEFAGQKRDYRVTVNSGVSGANPIPDGYYAVFSITTDEVGNMTVSTSYDMLGFDNAGPSARSVSLRDTSPLPFPSADPSLYISDVFTISGSIFDAGIGFNFTGANTFNGTLSFCGSTDGVPTNIPFVGTTNTISFNNLVLDSNRVAPSDGECIVTFTGPDALGNVATGDTGQRVIFDNTDPNIDIVRPMEGQVVAAGQSTPFESNISDITTGINPAFTKTFWNDYLGTVDQGGSAARTAARFVAAPVEFRIDPLNSTNPGNSNPGPVALTGNWLVRYPGLAAGVAGAAITGRQDMMLNGLVVDRAGNATVQNRRVRVDPTAAIATPSLGGFDAYQRNSVPVYTAVATRDDSHRVVQNAATPFNPTLDFNVDLRVSGTFSRAGGMISEVNTHRELDVTTWNQIVAYQRFNDPTLAVRPGSDLANRRLAFGQLTPGDTAPQFLIGDTNTSSDFHRTTTAVRGANAFAGLTTISSIVTDSTGQYSVAEEFRAASTIQNTTSADALAAGNFQFVASVVGGNKTPVYGGTAVPVGNYALQGSNNGNTWFNIPAANVTYVSDNGNTLVNGQNNLQAFYNSAGLTYTQFRLVINDGELRIGQEFTR